jgi:hypothetical protein
VWQNGLSNLDLPVSVSSNHILFEAFSLSFFLIKNPAKWEEQIGTGTT